jgi:Zn-dependent protease
MNKLHIVIIIYGLISIAISITLHEFMHGYTSKLLGDTTAADEGRLTFNPLKHIDPFTTVLLPILLVTMGLPPFGAAKPVSVNFARLKYEEFGGALVGIAGPLTNLALAIVAGIILRFMGPQQGGVFDFLQVFTSINIAFFVFNMVPFPPLDGSRVLYAFAPAPLQRLMDSIEKFGLLAIGIFILVLIPFISPLLRAVNSWIMFHVTGNNNFY